MIHRSWLSTLAFISLTATSAWLVASCGTVSTSQATAAIEPRADLEPGAACDHQFGTAKVNAFFSAINRGDVSAAQQLFPVDGQGEFRMQPILEFAPSLVRSIEAGRLLADNDADAATSRTEVARLVSSLSGLHFVFTAPLAGSGATVKHVSPQQTVRVREVDFGPVLWRATGRLLERHGKKSVSGGGKIAVACDTGHLIRVTLGASNIAD